MTLSEMGGRCSGHCSSEADFRSPVACARGHSSAETWKEPTVTHSRSLTASSGHSPGGGGLSGNLSSQEGSRPQPRVLVRDEVCQRGKARRHEGRLPPRSCTCAVAESL